MLNKEKIIVACMESFIECDEMFYTKDAVKLANVIADRLAKVDDDLRGFNGKVEIQGLPEDDLEVFKATGNYTPPTETHTVEVVGGGEQELEPESKSEPIEEEPEIISELEERAKPKIHKPKTYPPTPENTKLAAMQISVLNNICDLKDAGVEIIKTARIAERMRVIPQNINAAVKALIKKGFVEKEGEGRGQQLHPLKRPDGSKYEIVRVDGVQVIPARVAGGGGGGW